MTALAALLMPAPLLDGDQRASVSRLDADISAIELAAPDDAAIAVIERLRHAVVGAYWGALAHAAGKPNDPRWHEFIASVTALLTRVPDFRYSYAAELAVARLHAVVDESTDLR
jgi:hypothetical protein